MKQIVPSLRHPGRVLAIVAIAAVLNCLPVRMPGDTEFFLGFVAVFPLVLLLPVPWAIVAALVAALPALQLGGRCVVLALAGVEAAWLATVGRRWRSAVLADLVFWLGIGVPLGLAYAAWIDVVAFGDALAFLCNHVLNALTSVLIADLAVRFTSLSEWLGAPRDRPTALRGMIFSFVFTLAALPLVLLAFGVSLLLRRSAAVREDAHLQQAIVDVGRQLDVHFRLHRAAIMTVARTLEAGGASTSVLLHETRQAHPDVITMIVTDRDGRVTATSPEAAAAFGNVSDRPYFRSARDRNEPVVSGVFRGRGFGRDLLLAISVPLHDARGEFAGVVEASLEVRRMKLAIAQLELPRDVAIAVVDATGRVVIADAGSGLRPLRQVAHSEFAALLEPGEGAGLHLFEVVGAGGMRQAFRARIGVPTFGLRVVAVKPAIAGLDQLFSIYLLLGVVVAAALVASAWLAKVASRRLAAPLERFGRDAVDQAESGAISEMAPPGEKVPQEIAMVFAAFNCLVARTRESHLALVRTNAELDARVAERTKELRAAQERAEAASRSKTEFVAMTGHEIRTPLNAIIGLAEALEQESTGGVAQERLRTIRRAGKRLLGVVNDLLDLSRVEAGKLEWHFQPAQVGAMAREVVALLKAQAAGQGLTLELVDDPALELWVQMDTARLQQVLINLVGNALKFTTDGGVQLRIQAAAHTSQQSTLRFAVVDTGPGISAEAQKRLFQPYVQLGGRAANNTPGTGLGLSISRRLVEALGGELAVQSIVGVGSEFHFTVTFQRATPPVERVSPAAPLAATGLRMLIVDDNPANQEVLKAFLGRKAAKLEVADNARDAIAWLERETFDVALVDLEMPEEGGDVVVRAVTEQRAGFASNACTVIAVSAHTASEKRAECLVLGFADFLPKPIDRNELNRLLAKVAESVHPAATA